VASIVLLNVISPSKLSGELELFGNQVWEALDVSEVLFLCEQHRVDAVIIAADVKGGEIIEKQLRGTVMRLKSRMRMPRMWIGNCRSCSPRRTSGFSEISRLNASLVTESNPRRRSSLLSLSVKGESRGTGRICKSGLAALELLSPMKAQKALALMRHNAPTFFSMGMVLTVLSL
jgi:hypothetical protein